MAIRDLFVRVKGDKTHLDTTLKGAEGSINKFSSTVKRLGVALAATFTVSAIFAFGKAIIGASERLSDKFSFAVAGAKGVTAEFFRMIGTGDFRNFLTGLSEGYTKAVALAKAMDDLVDNKAYAELIISGLKSESAQTTEIVKDNTGKYTIDQRKQAAEKLKSIEEEIKKRTIDIAGETFTLESRAWENRNKMAVSEAKDLYEKVNQISKEKQEQAYKDFDVFIKKFGLPAFLKEQGPLTTLFDFDEKPLRAYFNLMQTGESELLPKLFKSFQTFNETTTAAQERFNGVLRITNSLLKEEDRTILEKAGTGNIKMPSFGSKGQLAAGPAAGDQSLANDMGAQVDVDANLAAAELKLEEYMTKVEDILQSGKDMAIDLGGEFIGALGEAIGGGNMKDIGKSLLISFANFMSTFGKMLITLGIGMKAFQESLKNLFTNPLVPIVAGVALMATAGIIRGAAQKAANGVSGGGSSGGGYSSQASSDGGKIELKGVLRGSDIYLSGVRYGRSLSTGT